MNKFKLCFLILSFCTQLKSYAQVPIEYSWIRFKWEAEPLSPLPVGKTFNIGLPEKLTYLNYYSEVRKYWSPFGLILLNKWDTKNPADYTFKMDLSGIKILSAKTVEKVSNNTLTGSEFLRDYTFNFPAKLLVIENSTQQVIRTIDIVSDTQEFTRTFHRNFYIDMPVDPNYKKEIGFDSLKQLLRISETNEKLLKHLEGEFAREVIFERIKTVLIHLYGKALLRAEFASLNPKEKNRKYNFADYDSASQKLKQAYETLRIDRKNQAYQALLSDAETFYEGVLKGDQTRFENDVPAMTYWNLAEINLLKGNFEKSDAYYEKVKASRKPEGNFQTFWQPAYENARDFFQLRKLISEENSFYKK